MIENRAQLQPGSVWLHFQVPVCLARRAMALHDLRRVLRTGSSTWRNVQAPVVAALATLADAVSENSSRMDGIEVMRESHTQRVLDRRRVTRELLVSGRMSHGESHLRCWALKRRCSVHRKGCFFLGYSRGAVVHADRQSAADHAKRAGGRAKTYWWEQAFWIPLVPLLS